MHRVISVHNPKILLNCFLVEPFFPKTKLFLEEKNKLANIYYRI